MKGITPHEIICFWFSEPMASHWFSSTDKIDAQIRGDYEETWRKARDGVLEEWLESAEGCLAMAIVLDQFPLNMFRGTARSFSTESKAIEVALYAIEHGFDHQLPIDQLAFLYMPLMHSESVEHQAKSVDLFEAAGLESNARFARHHYSLIKRFGRFPHRNAMLGRESSREELEYLASKEAFTG